MTEELWRLRQVLAVTSMSRSWLYAEIAQGRFPAPVRVGLRAVAWRRSDIETWLASRPRNGGHALNAQAPAPERAGPISEPSPKGGSRR
jgi:prophage regulatory protein